MASANNADRSSSKEGSTETEVEVTALPHPHPEEEEKLPWNEKEYQRRVTQCAFLDVNKE